MIGGRRVVCAYSIVVSYTCSRPSLQSDDFWKNRNFLLHVNLSVTISQTCPISVHPPKY